MSARDSNAARLLALGCLPCVDCARIPILDAHTVRDWPALWCPGCCDIDEHNDPAGSFACGSSVRNAVRSWNEQQRDQLRRMQYLQQQRDSAQQVSL